MKKKKRKNKNNNKKEKNEKNRRIKNIIKGRGLNIKLHTRLETKNLKRTHRK